MKDFYKLFVNELKSAYDNEKQIIRVLPVIINGAKSTDLKKALNHHLKETKMQLERLEEIGMLINEDLSGAESEAIRGILKEGSKLIKQFAGEIKDAAIIAACQRVEHYEIALYGILKAFASQLEFKEAVNLINSSLEEEKSADRTLTKLAEGGFLTRGINVKAIHKKSA